MPGAGLEPARGFPQGILSFRPLPGTGGRHSETARTVRQREARTYLDVDTAAITNADVRYLKHLALRLEDQGDAAGSLKLWELAERIEAHTTGDAA
jgi:hypothetical protein